MKPWSYPLLPFSWLYSGLMKLRNLAFSRGWKASQDFPVPILSIGNVTLGGTGKTPMAEFLLEALQSMQFHPAYLSRGYGRKTKGYYRVLPSEGDSASFGDEALLIASRYPELPVAVCESRAEGARKLLATEQPGCIVLDDAFQHRAIQRDLDLVMIDCSRPPHRDAVLPAGRLRESLKALERADFWVFSKFRNQAELLEVQKGLGGLKPRIGSMIMEMAPRHYCRWDNPQLALPLDDLKGLSVLAFSGLGNNAHFKESLEQLGLQLLDFLPFPDHHDYQPADLEKILSSFGAQKEIKPKLPPALVLTTEKDYYRLKGKAMPQAFAALPLGFIKIGMKPLAGWEQFEKALTRIASEKSNGAN